MSSDPSVFACDMNALTLAERVRHGVNTSRLLKSLQGVDENANGYALHFSNETQTIQQAAEFISLERLCCPFFDFSLHVGPGNEPIDLRLTGADGIKDFIRSEFGGVIR